MDRKIGLGFGFAAALGVAAPSFAQQAVQWLVEDGGNGHWYRGHQASEPVSWSQARSLSEASGGHLATLTSQAENSWVFNQLAFSAELWNGPQGPYLSGFRTSDSGCGPNCEWQWVTGEVWAFTAWDPGNPSGGTEAFLHFGNTVSCWCPGPRWNDIDDTSPGWTIRALIIEWSADCNGDGIVDYGQILQGQLADADSNGIPDLCEVDRCPGDVNESGVVNGIDLAAILAYWGTDGGKFPRTDANGDGIVDANDLAIVLSGWGNCP